MAVWFTAGQYLVQASLNSKVRLVNYQNGKVVKTYTGHKNNTFTSDMTFVTHIGGRPSIAAGSEDGGIVCWDVNSRQVGLVMMASVHVSWCAASPS